MQLTGAFLIVPSILTKAMPKRGHYLKTNELICLKCDRRIKISKGYYEFGDRIKCECGSTFRFICIAQVYYKGQAIGPNGLKEIHC